MFLESIVHQNKKWLQNSLEKHTFRINDSLSKGKDTANGIL